MSKIILNKKQIKKDLDNAMLALDALRNRFGYDALTYEERLKTLEAIYDSATLTLEQGVLGKDYTGTGALTTVLDRVTKQIEWLRERNDAHNDKKGTIKISWSDSGDD